MTMSGKNEIIGNIGGVILAICLMAMAGANFYITGNTTVLYFGGICLLAAGSLIWIVVKTFRSERQREAVYDQEYFRENFD